MNCLLQHNGVAQVPSQTLPDRLDVPILNVWLQSHIFKSCMGTSASHLYKTEWLVHIFTRLNGYGYGYSSLYVEIIDLKKIDNHQVRRLKHAHFFYYR